MSFPTTSVNRTNVDGTGDHPDIARADLLDLIDKVNDIIANGAPLTLSGASQTMSALYKLAGVGTDPLHPVTKGQMETALQYAYIDLLNQALGTFTATSVSFANANSFIRKHRWPVPGPSYPAAPFAGTVKLSGVLTSSIASGSPTGVTIDLRAAGSVIGSVTVTIGTDKVFEVQGTAAAGAALSFDVTAVGGGASVTVSMAAPKFECFT